MSGRWGKKTLFCIGILVTVVWAQIDKSAGIIDTVTSSIPAKVWNPVITGGLSALVPGGGQIYTGHYIKAGAFIALEAITAAVANFWFRTSEFREEEADLYKLLADISLSQNDTIMNREEASLLRFDALNARYSMYHALSWMIGGYVYNIFDAIGSSRYFSSDSEKSAVKAAWLSAIPGLGLG